MVFFLRYKLIWCPRKKRKVLTGPIKKRLKELLLEKADKLGIDIEDLIILPDQVHLVILQKSPDSPHHIAQQLKGYSSHVLREEFKQLLRMPSLWTRNYCCVPNLNEYLKVVNKFVKEQKDKLVL
jgi:putative transposase